MVAALAALSLASFARAEVVQKGGIRVKFEGRLTPNSLPRVGRAPVRVSVGATITPLRSAEPPRLKRISIAINSAGEFSPGALPVCTVRDIQPSTTQNALKACGDSLVGTGTFSAKILLPQEAAFPAGGKLYAFNGVFDGHPAILAHVYGTEPVPTSFTLPFEISSRKGELGTVLTASLAEATGKAGYITGLTLSLGGSAISRESRRGYLTAGCPAPKGFGGAVFPFAKASFEFDGRRLTSTLVRNCKVRR
ncbi:MAG TPA: hypothetical protein VGH14_01000 [Solirubrobacterales bacterium]